LEPKAKQHPVPRAVHIEPRSLGRRRTQSRRMTQLAADAAH